MSKQTGLIKLKGNIGGISFYKLNGNDLARMSNGPSKERIASEKSFQRTRENNNEFGGSATAAKSIRVAISTSLQNKCDMYMSARLNKVFREILKKSTGVRGQRAILLSANKSMLEGFDFDNRLNFANKFLAPYTVVPNATRNQCVITVPSFIPATLVKAPIGATHFRLVSAIGVESDYAYNAVTDRYEATDPTLNQLNALVYGTTTAINSTTAATFTLTAVLPGTPAPTMTATVSVVQCLGIEFFQRIGTTDYLLATDNCIKVVKVF
jgi:hypothetical protein